MFFVGEGLRHLVESGAVARRDGRWAAQRPLAELGIPEGVREVVGRRLSRLPPAANEILAVAAAVGREFDLALLAEAAEAGTEAVLDALEGPAGRLGRRAVLAARPRAAGGPGPGGGGRWPAGWETTGSGPGCWSPATGPLTALTTWRSGWRSRPRRWLWPTSSTTEAGFWAHMWRFFDLFEVGDPGWAATLEACGCQADRLRQPYFAWLAGALRGIEALATGRLDDAERLALATRQTGREWGVPESSVEGIWGGQLFVLRYEQGRLAEVEPTIASFAESQPGLPVWRARLALLHCETGAPSQAQAHLESLAANLDALPRNVMWLSDMVPLALVAAALGDTSRSAAVFARLAPYTGRNSMTGLGSMGSVDLGLALLTATLGRLARGWP